MATGNFMRISSSLAKPLRSREWAAIAGSKVCANSCGHKKYAAVQYVNDTCWSKLFEKCKESRQYLGSRLEVAPIKREVRSQLLQIRYFDDCMKGARARLDAEIAATQAQTFKPSGLDKVANAVLNVLTLGGRIDYAARDTTPPAPATPSTFETNGFLQGQRDNGGNKLCVYNKFGQSSIITVGKFQACPR